MDRQEFMNQLEGLLSDIPQSEREKALRYYEDYLTDAGEGKEQEKLNALGSPEQVAAGIRKGLGEGTDHVPDPVSVHKDTERTSDAVSEAGQTEPAHTEDTAASGFVLVGDPGQSEGNRTEEKEETPFTDPIAGYMDRLQQDSQSREPETDDRKEGSGQDGSGSGEDGREDQGPFRREDRGPFRQEGPDPRGPWREQPDGYRGEACGPGNDRRKWQEQSGYRNQNGWEAGAGWRNGGENGNGRNNGPWQEGPYQREPWRRGPYQGGPYQEGPNREGSYQRGPWQGQYQNRNRSNGGPGGPWYGGPYQNGGYRNGGPNAGYGAGPGRNPQRRRSPGEILLLVLLAVCAIPIVVPLVLGVLLTVFFVLLAVVLVLASLIIAGIAVLIAGIVLIGMAVGKFFVAPMAAIYLLGGGMLCAGIGLALTALMTWLTVKIVPAACRGFVGLCRWPFRKRTA